MSHIKRYKGNPRADCNTVVLPQNLRMPADLIFSEDFETAGDWTASAGSRAANVTEYKTGTQSMKLTTPSGTVGKMHKTINWDLSASGWHIGVWIFIHQAVTNLAAAGQFVDLCNNTTMSQIMRGYFRDATLRAGWVLAYIPKEDFVSYGSGTFANPIVRVRPQATPIAGQIVDMSVDNLYVAKSMPTIMFTFDDGYESQYTEAYTYMKFHNIPGTLYVKTNLANTNPISVTQMQKMYANGWVIGNHTQTHPHLNTLDAAGQLAELQNAETDLIGWGMANYTKHVAYPYGSLTDWDDNTLSAMATFGGKTGRTTLDFGGYKLPYLPFDAYQIGVTNISTATSLATAKGYIDHTISQGNCLTLLFHSIGTGGSNWTVADFRELIDYVVSKKSQIQPITIHDYYNLTLGPVRVMKAK